MSGDDLAFFAVGFVFAAIVGYISIKFLLQFLTNNNLYAFAAYRVGVGLIVLGLLSWNLVASVALT